MKIRSSFTHPEGVSKLYEFYFFCWTQKKIFWRMLVTKQFLVPIDFHCIFFHTMEVNGDQQLFGYQHSSKNVVFNKRQNLMQV